MCKRKGIVKQLYAVLMISIIILSLVVDSIQVKAVGISMPILPYIPPNSAQIMDLISNAFGVTAPAIEDAEEKMEAYMKIYQGILGQTYTTFKEKLDTIIDNAKTSGKIAIDSSASTIIQQALNQALQNGYDDGNSTDGINGINNVVNQIKQDFPQLSNITDSFWDSYKYTITDYLGTQNVTAICSLARNNTYVYLAFYDASIELQEHNNFIEPSTGGTYWKAWTRKNSMTKFKEVVYYCQVNANRLEMNYKQQEYIFMNEWYSPISNFKNYGKTTRSVTVQVQSQSITDALSTQEVIPVTANTDTADMTGDIVINIPAVTVYPAENVNDLPTVQEKLGVIPTTPDTTTEQLEAIMEQLQEAQAETYGDVAQYSINLTEYFPFCIPFDIGNILTMFVAEPQAPCVTFELPIGYDAEEGIIMEEFTLDLSQFDTVALWCRRGMLLVFIVGLAMVTRQVFLRG